MSEQALVRRDQPFDVLLASAQRLDVRAIGALSEIPASLAARLPEAAPFLGGQSILTLLDADPAIWRPTIASTLTLYANRIDLWELGAPDAPFSGNLPAQTGQPPDLAERYTRLYARTYAEVAGLLSRPQLIVPWNALFDFDARQFPNAMLDLRFPSVIKPSQIPAYMENFRQGGFRPTAGSEAGHLEPLAAPGGNLRPH